VRGRERRVREGGGREGRGMEGKAKGRGNLLQGVGGDSITISIMLLQ